MTPVEKIIRCFRNGNKLLIIGNGGSAEMASHMAAEFVNKMELDRDPLPAIALTDIANVTSIANDSDFKWVFQRQIRALGKPGDILIIFTTSYPKGVGPNGHSANLYHAESQAHLQDIDTILAPQMSKTTAEIQEEQLKWLHDVAREVEKEFV